MINKMINYIKKMNISTKILTLVIAICAFALISISIASYATVKKISSYSLESSRLIGYSVANEAGDAMIEQTHDFLQIIADEQARSCDNALEELQFNVLMIEGAMMDIFDNPEHYEKSREIINHRDVTPGIYSNVWQLPGNEEMTPEIEKEIALMSNMEIMMKSLAVNPGLIELYAGLESGLLYAYTSLPFDDPGYDPRDRLWYTEALAHPGKTIFTEAYKDAFGKGMIISSAKTVFDSGGNFIGVASIDVKLDFLNEIILKTQITESGYAFILDNNGRYIVHPDMGKEGFREYVLEEGDASEFADGYRRIMNGEDGFISGEIDGEVYYLTFSHMSAADWSVGVVVSEDEILSSLKKLTNQIAVLSDDSQKSIVSMTNNSILIFVIIFLIVCAMVFVLAVNLSAFISKPIQKLASEIENINEDNWEYEIPVESNDEIGALTQAFNKMTGRLYEYTMNMLELSDTKLKLEVDANTDALTGIYNRRHFMLFASKHLERALRSKSAVFLVMFDIDHYKNVNDVYGHSAGDEVLRIVAARTSNIIRPCDMFARYGGDEFVLLITDVKKTIVYNLADRIRLGISQTPIVADDVFISVTASFGIAKALPSDDLDSVLKSADEALYKSKSDGRNRITFYNNPNK